MKNLAYTAALISIFFTSCSSDDDNVGEPLTVTAPATYSFERNDQSTVSFSGQTTRIAMASELVSAFNDFDNSTEASLLNMYAHEAGANDFSDPALNASGKNIRSKTAASRDYFNTNSSESLQIKETFEGYISSHLNELYPNRNTLATAGQAGQIADGESVRYVLSNGLEMNQVFAKGLIGALMTDQMLNNYLGMAVLDEGTNRSDNDNDIVVEGESYTMMEHKWDEA
ncbi:MAG: DUF4856 domain-containing protein, partial [Flavobacteriaceae bacterium]|nr:DUF4856 domain-containing protein [Flavobacteriaceae bacterium]